MCERGPGQDLDILQHRRNVVSARDSFLLGDIVCFPDLGFQVAGRSGQSGACVMKRASNTAAVIVRYTAQTLLSALETARSTRIACIMKFLVRTVSSRRERVGQFRRAARAQTVKLG